MRHIGSDDVREITAEGTEPFIKYIRMRDLALAYIFTSIDSTRKAMVGKVWFPVQAWKILETTFQAASVASIDEKVLKLQSIKLQKGEAIGVYSNWVQELASELESTEYSK